MPERAHPDDPIWGTRLGLFPTPALAYLRRRYRFCRPFVRGKKALDIPCGNGMGLPFFAGAAHLTGIDISEEAVRCARERFGGATVELKVASMEKLPFADRSLEVVTCLEGIEHVPRAVAIAFFMEASRVLEPQGRLLMTCPLSVGGWHSSNPFHTYEWAGNEFLATAGRWFQIDRQVSLKGPEGPVLMLVARNRGLPANQSAAQTASEDSRARYQASIARVSAWIDARWSGPQAAYTGSDAPHLLPTCFAVLAAETLGTLPQWPAARRAAVLEYLGSQQDPASGLFGLPLLKQEDLAWQDICDLRYVRYQIAYFALSAFTALGGRPPHALAFAESFCNPDYALGWIEAGPWHNPWNHSNRIMFLLRFLIHIHEQGNSPAALRAIDTVLAELRRQQDPRTGLWHGYAGCSNAEAIYAAYHIFPFMFWRGIRPAHPERVLDAALSMVYPDGLFGSQPGSGACEDLDAIDVLVKFSMLTDHRGAEVRAVLTRAFDRILQLQRDDGGFPNHLLPPGARATKTLKRRLAEAVGLDVLLNRRFPPHWNRVYYSGWFKVGAIKSHSDMWAGWFRPLALNLIASRYPDLGKVPAAARFHGLPALGWHDETLVRASRLPAD